MQSALSAIFLLVAALPGNGTWDGKLGHSSVAIPRLRQANSRMFWG